MMDRQAIDLTATPSVTGGIAFEVPVHGTGSALDRLLGHSLPGPAQSEVAEILQKARLGVASALFRALQMKHPPTARHSLRVALACSSFARHLKLEPALAERIEVAGLLHDVGKIGIPDHILHKPSQLDPDERSVMRRYAEQSVHLLQAFCNDAEILAMVRYANAWYDGSRSVPNAFVGDAIPLGARILAIHDAFDAMTTDLPYRQAMSRERAIAELFERTPSQFDPKLVAAFSDMEDHKSFSLHAQSIRRWVEMASEQAGEFWSFEAPIVQPDATAQNIFQTRLLESMNAGVVFLDLSGHILVWNQSAELMTGLSKESVHHQEWHPQIIDLRDCEGNTIKVTTCPLLKCLRNHSERTERFSITNRGKKTPIFVDVQVMPVKDPHGACHGAIMILHDVSSETSLEARVENLHTRATRDALTGVCNRAEFDRRHEELVTEHLHSGVPLSLVICDIDRFKLINDTYGHQAGDAALIAFAGLIETQSRGDDLVTRYGGEEFVVLCPGCTNDVATRKAEEMRREVAATVQPALNNTKMTASFGVTELQQGDTTETMLKRSDRALYQAKETGRNRVVQLGAGMSDTQGSSDNKPAVSTWFSWGRRGAAETNCALVERTLRSNGPLKVATEKVRGFIADNNAEVLETIDNSVSLCFDDRNQPTQRRQSDRPITLLMDLALRDDTERGGTFVDVKIRSKRGRDRRADDIGERADRLYNSLKSYLIAEEI